MRFAALLVILLGIACPVHADCGDETYFILSSSIPASVLKRAVGMVEFFNLKDGAAGQLAIVERPGDRRLNDMPPSETLAVGRMPTCEGLPRGLAGHMFPLVEETTGFVRIIADVRKPRAVWVSKAAMSEAYGNVWVDRFETFRLGTGLDIFFGRGRAKICERPGRRCRWIEGPQPRMWPSGVYRVLEQRGAWVKVAVLEEWGKPLVAKGWVLIREHGALRVWPAYYDDC